MSKSLSHSHTGFQEAIHALKQIFPFVAAVAVDIIRIMYQMQIHECIRSARVSDVFQYLLCGSLKINPVMSTRDGIRIQQLCRRTLCINISHRIDKQEYQRNEQDHERDHSQSGHIVDVLPL